MAVSAIALRYALQSSLEKRSGQRGGGACSSVSITGGHEGLLVTLEAAIVSTLHTARPPASMRGRSVRSARKPAGTRAIAYSTCSGRACLQHPIWPPGLMAASISSIPVQRRQKTAMTLQHVSQGTMVGAKAEGAHCVADSQQGALVVAQIQVWCDQWQKRWKGKSAEEQSRAIQLPVGLADQAMLENTAMDTQHGRDL